MKTPILLILFLFLAGCSVDSSKEVKTLTLEEIKNQQINKRGFKAVELKKRYEEKGLNIDVKLEGKDITTLRLISPIFNDQFANEFERKRIPQQFCTYGFKQIIMDNGKGGAKQWTCN